MMLSSKAALRVASFVPKTTLRLSSQAVDTSISSAVSIISKSLPSNLHLADVKALIEPKKTVVVPAYEHLFPTLDVAREIKVIKFGSPGTFDDKSVSLDPRIFGVAIRKDIVHEVIRYHRHKRRQPKKTKRINEISGSTKKPRPQKGTGQARVGHKRNSVWRGGQKAHGPRIRDYSINLNRKVRAMGVMVSLAAKLREGNLFVFDKLAVETLKTKELHAILKSHGLAEGTSLFLDDSIDKNFELASRNIYLMKVLPQQRASVYEIVRKEKLVVTASALANMQARLIDQHTHQGKRRRLLRSMQAFSASVASASADISSSTTN